MVVPPWVAEAEAGGVWRTGVKGLGMGLYRGVEEEASVLSLFPYSLSKDGPSIFLLLPPPLTTRLGSRAPSEGAERLSALTNSGAGLLSTLLFLPSPAGV